MPPAVHVGRDGPRLVLSPTLTTRLIQQLPPCLRDRSCLQPLHSIIRSLFLPFSPFCYGTNRLPATQHIAIMILRRRAAGGDTCTSAGRVTAHLLLSFLAFSPPSAHAASQPRADDQAVLQLHPDYFNPAPEPPAPAEHTFVSHLCYLPFPKPRFHHQQQPRGYQN